MPLLLNKIVFMTKLGCCLRPKAKDLGITQVVLVEFFVSKTHATSLSLHFYYILNILIFSLYYFLSPYLYIILLYISTYLPMSIYLFIYINIPTFLWLPTNLCQPTYQTLPTYINIPIYLYQHTYPPMSTYQHIPTHVNLPSSTYLPLPIPKYQYRITTDPGASIGLVTTKPYYLSY